VPNRESNKTGLQALPGKEIPLDLFSRNFWDSTLAIGVPEFLAKCWSQESCRAILAAPSGPRMQPGGREVLMNIGVLREKDPHDRRVALTPPVVRQLVERGNAVWVERGNQSTQLNGQFLLVPITYIM
jgi:hypothetical protein